MKYCELWGVNAAFKGSRTALNKKRRKAPRKETTTIYTTELIKDLCKYFSFPDHEITRLVNCVFHLILTYLRENAKVSIYKFGTFYNHWVTGCCTYSIRTGTINPTRRVTYRSIPAFKHANYATHVLSPKKAFAKPLFIGKNTNMAELISSNPMSLPAWYKSNDAFYKRSFMLYDNPYSRVGEWKGHILKESTCTSGLSKSEKEAYALFEKHFKSEFVKRNKLVYKRFVINDFIDLNKTYWCYHNYLPGKFYIGSDFNFESTVKEARDKVNRYEILDKRQYKFQVKMLDRAKKYAEEHGEDAAKKLNFYCPVNLEGIKPKQLDKINFNFLEQEYGITSSNDN